MKPAIHTEKDLDLRVQHVALEIERLTMKIIGVPFPVTSLTIFAHSQDEFDRLTAVLSRMGKPYGYNNGPRVALREPIVVGANRIAYIRIRKPDPDRPQVGCADLDTDYDTFRENYLSKHPKNLCLIKRKDYDMVELHDQAFDVLAYVVSR